MKKHAFLTIFFLCALMVVISSSALATSLFPALATPKPTEPEIIFVVSPEQVTAIPNISQSAADEAGVTYRYTPASHEAYQRYGTALAEAGFELVSNEQDDKGAATLVVSNGSFSLTIVYQMNTNTLYVTYPNGVVPAARELFTYDTMLNVGDVITLEDGVTLRLDGWEEVDNYTYYYTDSYYMVSARTGYESSNETKQCCAVMFTVVNERYVEVFPRKSILDVDVSIEMEQTANNIRYGMAIGEQTTTTTSRSGEGALARGKSGHLAVLFYYDKTTTAPDDLIVLTFTTPTYETTYAYVIQGTL